MIEFASEYMIPELKRLWHYGFPEDTAYCDFYFDNYFSCDNCMVVCGEKGIETATYLFRGNCVADGKTYNAVYWYGGATWGEHRRKGNLSRSLDFLQKYCVHNDIDIIAVRPVEATYSCYDKRGFYPNVEFQRTKANMVRFDASGKIEKCGFEEFNCMREAYLDDYCINWNSKTAEYMYKDICLDGGTVKFTTDKMQCYAAYTLYNDELLVRETNCPVELIGDMVRSLCRYLNYTGEIVIDTKKGVKPKFSEVMDSKSMYYAHIWVSPQSGLDINADWYINLTAD